MITDDLKEQRDRVAQEWFRLRWRNVSAWEADCCKNAGYKVRKQGRFNQLQCCITKEELWNVMERG